MNSNTKEPLENYLPTMNSLDLSEFIGRVILVAKQYLPEQVDESNNDKFIFVEEPDTRSKITKFTMTLKGNKQ